MIQKEKQLEQLKEAYLAVAQKDVGEQPDECIDSCEESIYKPQKKRGRRIWKAVSAILSVLLVLVATLTISFVAFPDLRINVLNMILEVYEAHTDFSFEEDPELEITVGWMPEGFGLVEDEGNSDSSWKTFQNDEGASVHIKKSKPVTMSVDTEDAQMKEIRMHGYKATLITKGYEARVIWHNTDEDRVYFVNTEYLPAKTMLRVAKSIH